jgi:cytochrome P450
MAHLMMSNLEKYYPEAHKFIPERWVKDDSQYNKAHSFVTMPFGFGPRMCIGRRFAELEIETLVAKVSSHADCFVFGVKFFFLHVTESEVCFFTLR